MTEPLRPPSLYSRTLSSHRQGCFSDREHATDGIAIFVAALAERQGTPRPDTVSNLHPPTPARHSRTWWVMERRNSSFFFFQTPKFLQTPKADDG